MQMVLKRTKFLIVIVIILCEVEDVLYAKLQIPIMQTLW